MSQDEFRHLSEILSHYDLGELVGYTPDERGTVNTSYTLDALLDGRPRRYFLRRYKKGIKEEELVFEHAVINHLTGRGFDLVSRVYPTRDGGTYLKQEGDGMSFYAIFEFLLGEDKYTWVDPCCEPGEVASAATALARFHQAVGNWQPQGKRDEPRIVELIPTLPQTIETILESGIGTVFDDYLLANAGMIDRHLTSVLDTLHQPDYRSLPELVIHCDYHPGNLKFSNGEVVGMFDFDWSKIDKRCFDVALGLVYFFSSWGGQDEGVLHLDGVARFLRAYQDAFEYPHATGALNPLEVRFLPAMIAAGNLYVMNWALQDYAHKSVDPHEYLIYLRHHVSMIAWLQQPANLDHLESAIAASSFLV